MSANWGTMRSNNPHICTFLSNLEGVFFFLPLKAAIQHPELLTCGKIRFLLIFLYLNKQNSHISQGPDILSANGHFFLTVACLANTVLAVATLRLDYRQCTLQRAPLGDNSAGSKSDDCLARWFSDVLALGSAF